MPMGITRWVGLVALAVFCLPLLGCSAGCCPPPETPDLACIPPVDQTWCCYDKAHIDARKPTSICDPSPCYWPPEKQLDANEPPLTPTWNRLMCCPDQKQYEYTWGPLDCLRYPFGRNGRDPGR